MTNRGQRTSRWQMANKVAFITWGIALVAGLPWLLIAGSVFGSLMIGLLFFTAIIYGTIFAAMWGMSILLNTISWFVDRDPDDKRFRKTGYDVYFDNLPTGFLGINKDSKAVRLTGQEQPQAAPRYRVVWNCNACGAENPEPHGNCWSCGNCLENEP